MPAKRGQGSGQEGAEAGLAAGEARNTLDVREELGLGRYFVAARPLAAGELVLQASATAGALSDAFLDTHCSGCFRPTDALPCAKCRKIRFCPACFSSGQGGWRV
jgi:hypothetical protein